MGVIRTPSRPQPGVVAVAGKRVSQWPCALVGYSYGPAGHPGDIRYWPTVFPVLYPMAVQWTGPTEKKFVKQKENEENEAKQPVTNRKPKNGS